MVEQPGTIRVLRRGRTLKRPFLDITRLVGSDGREEGLLSVAFPPDYRASRRFYVYYTDHDGDIRIDEFKRNRARPGASRAVEPAAGDLHPPSDLRQPQRRPAPVPRQRAVHRHRRRRLRRRPAQQRPEHRGAARQAAADRSPPDRVGGGPTGSRARTRSSARPVGTRSSATASATPTASASRTSRPSPTGSRSATSARAASRRSTTCRFPRPGAPTSAGTPWRDSRSMTVPG